MLVNLEDALRVKEHAIRAKTWKQIGSPEHCRMLGFTSWADMIHMGFSSPQNYIEFLEGKWATNTNWSPNSLKDWEDCKTQCSLGKYHARELCEIILKKYGDRHPSLYEFTPSTTVLIKAKDQMNRVKDAIDDEIRQFNETGEITLGIKDKALEKRINDLEKQIIKHRDHILSMDNLLIALAENTQKDDTSEAIINTEPLDDNVTVPEVFITGCIILIVLIVSFLIALYYDTTTILDISSNLTFGRRLLQ